MSEFRIDLRDAEGNIVGDGPLTTVLSMEDTRALDAIGSAQFVMPAEDPRAQYIGAGAMFDLYDGVDGYLGRFYYRSKSLDAQAKGGARLTVMCRDQLVELARTNVYFHRTYTNQTVAAVVQALAALAGWTASADAGIGITTVAYEGDAVITALDVLRDRWGKHFRLGDTSVVEFGGFGADSGIVLTQLRGQTQVEIQQNRNVAIVDTIRLVEESDEIYNRIVALGAGQGTSQLTLGDATASGAYAVQVGVNADGSPYYFIEDVISIAQYGARTKIIVLPTVRPITNSSANIINASNALYYAATAYLTQHKDPLVTYSVTLLGLRSEVRVGDLVRLQYRGIVDEYAFIDVDDYFYVMDVTRRRDANGNRTALLTIASLAERRVDDTEIMIDVINDLKALKLSVPVTISRDAVGPYLKRMDSTHTAEFTVRLGSEVTNLNYAILRFRTSPLKSSVQTVQTVNASINTSGGSNTTTTGASSITTSGGSNTTTTGASSIVTSDASSSNTTAGGSTHQHSINLPEHSHDIRLVDTSAGEFVRYEPGIGLTAFQGGGHTDYIATTEDGGNSVISSLNESAHSHNMAHTHGMNHTHGFNHTHGMNHTHEFAHVHDLTIPSHGHNVNYGIYADTTYPQQISLAINSVDVTSALGGTWAPTNASVEVEVDITTYLVNAAGGLRQNHRIEFSCATGQGEIEVEVDTLMSIQAITVT